MKSRTTCRLRVCVGWDMYCSLLVIVSTPSLLLALLSVVDRMMTICPSVVILVVHILLSVRRYTLAPTNPEKK